MSNKDYEIAQVQMAIKGQPPTPQSDWYLGIAKSYIANAEIMMTSHGKALNLLEASSYLQMAARVLDGEEA